MTNGCEDPPEQMAAVAIEDALSLMGLQDSVNWQCLLNTTPQNEAALKAALIPFCYPGQMQELAWSLPGAVRHEIVRIGARHGFTAKQTFSFRRGLLKCWMGMRPFMALNGNDDAKGRLIAEAFEFEVERFVRAHLSPDTLSSVVITTEAQRKAAADAEDRPYGPTPDLTFDPPITINGRTVGWIDAKMLYASCVLQDKNFMPESRLPSIAAKYNAAFGPGAFVFGSGFCDGLRDTVPALLLDSSPLDLERITSVIESDQSETAMSLEEMRAALGLEPTAAVHPPPAPPPPPPAPQTTNTPEGVGIADEVAHDAPHEWNPRIRCHTAGTTTFHYHLCTRCGARGLRRKVSNKRATIVATGRCVAVAAF